MIIKLTEHKDRFCPFCGRKTFVYGITLENVVEYWGCERKECGRYLKIIVSGV
jgi:hypothetical protein